jgi:prepilin-type N-terminal cleavage/methylation domain-containing protein
MVPSKKRSAGFTLVELVLVIVIIGILAAIAIPRLSRGAAGASSAALSANLTMVRQAISLYRAEHNDRPPGADIANQLTTFTSVAGATNATKNSTYRYGPYLAAIPPCPVGENTGSNTILIDSTNSPPTPVTSGGQGWVYNPNTGEFLPNTNQTDDLGDAYKGY